MAESQCTCQSCEDARARRRPGYRCEACGGTGRVLSALGTLRPCSRCDAEGFSDWTREARSQ